MTPDIKGEGGVAGNCEKNTIFPEHPVSPDIKGWKMLTLCVIANISGVTVYVLKFKFLPRTLE